MLILLVQAALSAAAVIQLYRTRMLPNYYLAILGALLALVWLLFFKCQRYKVRGALTRLLSLALSAAMAASMLITTLFDLGAVARSMAASARGSFASGRPSCSALSTQDLTMLAACG